MVHGAVHNNACASSSHTTGYCTCAGSQPLPTYLYAGPSINEFSSTDGLNHTISCSQIKLQTRMGPAPAWFQQAALDPSSYNFLYCSCTGSYHIQVMSLPQGAVCARMALISWSMHSPYAVCWWNVLVHITRQACDGSGMVSYSLQPHKV